MAITAASVEANGWVLRVTHTAGLGAFASYTLDPNGTPRLVLASLAPGFTQSGGQAVAASTPRSLIATKPLRLPVQATNAGVRSPKTIDETDLGGGLTRVRIALSSHVYATDTNLTLTAASGWRSGEAAASGIPVTNNSTVAAPLPIVRWADVPYQLQGGAFDLEVVVVAHHPNGLAPVAGVKFTVTDGTTVQTYWTTGLATSTAYSAGGTGQPLRVYKVRVDPTAPVPLTKGLLRCDFEVCPWLGAAQKSDVAGTRSMTALGTAALATAALIPFVVAYNPATAWITPRYAYVSATGATAAAAANVSTVAATAAATPLATINLAIESLRLHAIANPAVGTVAAANGQAAIAQSLDGCRIRLAAGVTAGTGTTNVGAGVATAASWLVVEGDPGDANPAVNCILRSPAVANGNNRVTRVRFTGLAVEAQTNAAMLAPNAWLDGLELRGVAGQEATTGIAIGGSGGLQWVTNVKWWKHATTPAVSGSVLNPVLLRSVAVERSLGAPLIVNCARLPGAVAGTAATQGATTTAPATDAGVALDRIVLGNDFRFLNGAAAWSVTALANASAPAGLTLGKAYPVASRQAFVNNVCEVYGGAAPLWSSVGENNAIVATENVIEGNTFAGDRTNSFYNDLNLATIALSDSEDCLIRVNRFANNVALKCASKHDFFNDPAVLAQRGGSAYPYRASDNRSKALGIGAELTANGNIYHVTTAGTTAATGGPSGTGSSIADGTVTWAWFAAQDPRQHGYRPQATGAWPAHYGVMYEGNIDLQPPPPEPSSDPEFWFEFFGLGSNQLSADGVTVTSTPFTLDKSGTSNRLSFQPLPDGTGGGNYKPLTMGSGTYLLARAKSANVDTDSRGVPRVVPFAAGAVEGATATAVLPAADRQATRAGSPALGWAVVLPPAKGSLASRAAVSTTGWAATLAAAQGAVAMRAATSTVAWSTRLAGTRGTLAARAGAGAAAWGTALAVGRSVLATRTGSGATGWSVLLASARSTSATRAGGGAAAWATTLVVTGGRSAGVAAAGAVTWRTTLSPDPARAAMFASMPIVTTVGPWLIAVGAGRISVTDRTLPILLPGTLVPPERTLIVSGDFRTTLVN